MIESVTYIRCNVCTFSATIAGATSEVPDGWSEFTTQLPVHRNKRKHLCPPCTERAVEFIKDGGSPQSE